MYHINQNKSEIESYGYLKGNTYISDTINIEKGWNRYIYSISENTNDQPGGNQNPFELIIKRPWWRNGSEYHHIAVLFAKSSCSFKSIAEMSDQKLITKIRYAYNPSTFMNYVDVFYDGAELNKMWYMITNTLMPENSGQRWSFFENAFIVGTTVDSVPGNEVVGAVFDLS